MPATEDVDRQLSSAKRQGVRKRTSTSIAHPGSHRKLYLFKAPGAMWYATRVATKQYTTIYP